MAPSVMTPINRTSLLWGCKAWAAMAGTRGTASVPSTAQGNTVKRAMKDNLMITASMTAVGVEMNAGGRLAKTLLVKSKI